VKLSRSSLRGRLTILALVVVFPLVGSPAAWAQTGTASLVGDVTDIQKQVIPGATVTITHLATGASQVTVTDDRGAFRFGNVQPGLYNIKAELSGFKTSVVERVELQVDTATRQSITLEVGGITETVSVVSERAHLNTTDGSVGNVMSREQIRSLPVEAQNVVHLLSLQPGALFVPTSNPATVDPRYGSVAGARADQQSVTLDGVDVNDPQFSTAYTSAIRMTQEALQEFRVSTSNYNAEMGRSSGPQVSLITRSGTNQYDGSGYYTMRRTRTSSNEYFLKLSQLASGQPSKAPLLDKDIFGGSFGGPIRRNRLFFFGNIEALREKSETPVLRNVPSNSMRDGVLIYQCADASLCPGGAVRGVTGTHTVQPGFYGMTPAEIAAIDPLGIGPSALAMEYFRKYPSPNDPGRDGRNLMDFRFAAPIENEFLNLLSRVDYKAADNHSFFGRFGKQDDTINNAPQFPGLPPKRQRLFNNYGGALGYDAVVSPTLTNSFRYGFTQIDENNAGVTNNNYVIFRFISPYEGFGDTGSFTDTRETPTQNIVNDLSWFKGRHTMKVGTNIRYTRVPKTRTQSSFLSATVNPSWVAGIGRRNMPGSAFCTVPGCNLPPVATAGQAAYADTWLNMLGVLSSATQRANYNIDGTPQAPGTPVVREIASDEYEFYVQDAWQLRSNLTLTAGVRYSIYSPPYEVNGFQVAPTVSMGEWFNQRAQNALNGIPSNASPIVTFDLAGPKNGKKGFYDWDKNNFAPRVALAWTPTERIVVRGGYSKVFDRVGVGLATNFDEGFAFGMSTEIGSPFGLAYESNPGARFRGIDVMPPTMPAAPAGGFPQTPPIRAGIITQSIDDTLVTPSAHMGSAIVGFDLGRNYTIEAGYVGRFGRELLVRRDLAMPLNLVDPASRTDYFTAAQTMIRAAQSAGLTGNSPAAAFASLPAIAYWENIFPGAAGGGLTATQAVTRAYMQNGPDWITALYDLDTACSPACSKFGPYAYFAEQYDSLAGISSIGRSNYNGLNLTLRRRFADGVQFDFNYTLSKSEDMGSQVERGSAFGNAFSNGGYSGFLINSFEPELNYGTSDFDVRHQINTNWLAELPFGRGKRFGSGANGILNQIIGDWSVAGLMRWTSGFPFNVYNCRSCWATNWNLQGNAMLIDPNDLPETKTTKNKVDNRPSPFVDPTDALTHFRRALPGEVGVRNVFRGDGYFNIDLSLSKAWSLGIADHRLRFRWDIFNATNTPKFDVGQLTMFPDSAGFGRYNGTLATCDGQAGRCMQFAFRYEF
jgi:hypothetical protein